MKALVFTCLALLSLGAAAQEVRILNGTVYGLAGSEVIAHSGETDDGQCFVITRPAGDWDTLTYTKLYDGKCAEPLKDWGNVAPLKFRNGGTLNFEYDLVFVNGLPKFSGSIFISPLKGAPDAYKKKPVRRTELRKAEP